MSGSQFAFEILPAEEAEQQADNADCDGHSERCVGTGSGCDANLVPHILVEVAVEWVSSQELHFESWVAHHWSQDPGKLCTDEEISDNPAALAQDIAERIRDAAEMGSP